MPRRNIRKIKSKRNVRRRTGRFSMRRSVAPPPYPYLNSFHTLLQVCWAIAGTGEPSNNWQATIDPGWILSYSWKQLQNAFNIMKLHSINARYVPFMSSDAKGEYIFGLYDYNANSIPSLNASNFDKLVGTPGTVIRHGGQAAKLVWKPMEPNDRNWVLTNGSHAFATTWVVAAETIYYDDYASKTTSTAYIDGKIIANINVSFKGRPQSAKVEDVDPSSCCYKCFRRYGTSKVLERLRELERRLESGLSPASLSELAIE